MKKDNSKSKYLKLIPLIILSIIVLESLQAQHHYDLHFSEHSSVHEISLDLSDDFHVTVTQLNIILNAFLNHEIIEKTYSYNEVLFISERGPPNFHTVI